MDTRSEPFDPEDTLAAAIKRLREERRLTYTELAGRLTELGQPIAVLGLRRIEKGERRVTVGEIAALGKALGVPPIRLCFPVGDVPFIEVLPGRVMDTGAALEWFIGERPFASANVLDENRIEYEHTREDFRAWRAGGEPLHLFREHRRLHEDWFSTRVAAAKNRREAQASSDEDQRRSLLKLAEEGEISAREKEQALADHRNLMREQGMVLPRFAFDQMQDQANEDCPGRE